MVSKIIGIGNKVEFTKVETGRVGKDNIKYNITYIIIMN